MNAINKKVKKEIEGMKEISKQKKVITGGMISRNAKGLQMNA